MGHRRFSLRVIFHVACSLCAASATASPASPQLTDDQGAALTAMAHDAMLRYLTARTPAGQIPIPAALQGVVADPDVGWAVVLTLRYQGNRVAQVDRREKNLARSVATAAQRAMRSPHLPDRVDRTVLSQLTVEVEVLGRPQNVDVETFDRGMTRGLSGLMLTRGPSVSYVLPSTVLREDLAPSEMPRRCQLNLPTSKAVLDAKPRWAIFAIQHFVSLPDTKTVALYRGKVLAGGPVDSATARTAVRQMTRAVIKNQKPDGRYSGPRWPQDMVSHLMLTRAMALADRQHPDTAVTASVNAAMAAVARSILQTDRRAIVQPRNPADQLAATALTALVVDRLPTGAASDALRRKLTAAILLSTTAENPLPPAQLDPRDGKPPAARDASLALLALAGHTEAAATCDALRTYLMDQAADDPLARAWARYAGLHPPDGPPAQIGPNDPILDRRGGFALPAAEPTVLLTALCASPADRAAARRFCLNMIYRDGEITPAARGAAVGLVRDGPAGIAGSQEACAAAIEMLLAQPSEAIGP